MVDAGNPPALRPVGTETHRRFGHRIRPALVIVAALSVVTSIVSPAASGLSPFLRSSPVSAFDTFSGAAGTSSFQDQSAPTPGSTVTSGDAAGDGDLLVAGFDGVDLVRRYRSVDGSQAGQLNPSQGELGAARALAVGPDGLVYAAGGDTDRVVRFDPDTNSMVDVFVAAGTGGLRNPSGLAFSSTGTLLVTSAATGQVLEYDGDTGRFLGVLIDDGLDNPGGLAVGPNGLISVTYQNDDTVGIYRTNGTRRQLIDTGPGSGPVDVVIGPTGELLVAMVDGARIDRVTFDAQAGARRGGEPEATVETMVEGIVTAPTSLVIGPDGALWIADYGADEIRRIDLATGRDLGVVVAGNAPFGPTDLAFLIDGDGGMVSDTRFESGDRTYRWLNGLADPAAGVDFVANEGSADTEVDFAIVTAGYDAVVGDGEVALVAEGQPLADAVIMNVVDRAGEPVGRLLDESPILTDVDLGAEKGRRRTPSGPIGPGSDPTPAQAQVPDAASGDDDDDDAIEFDDVLPGVDVVYSANGGDVEYSFVIEPGADPDDISLDFDGAVGLRIEPNGDLLIEAESGPDYRSTAPVTYQEIDGEPVIVDSSYAIGDDGTVAFTLGSYDPTLPVIIDPTFVAVETAGGSYTSGSTIDLPVPSTTDTDDLMLAQIAYSATGGGIVTPPAGWTEIDTLGANGITQALYWRVATASEPAQYSFTLSSGSTDTAAGSITVYDGVDTASPIDASNGQANSSGAAVTAPSITSTVDSATLIAFFAVRDDGVVTPPGGMNERADVTSAAGGAPADEVIAASADDTLGAAGAAGPRTATVAATAGSIGHLVALTPDPSIVVVNSTGDASDDTVGDDVCDTGATNSQGDPECTLRAAIEEANASGVVDTVTFNIPSTESGYSASPLSYTLTPASGYPLITSTVTIDATTQPGWAGDPIVELDGSSAVGATAGLALRANNSTISGFIVHSFPDEGLEIDGSTTFGDDNVLTNNWVGLDVTGTVVGNTDNGILVTVDAVGNLVGGTGPNDGNRVAGSGGAGITVRTTSFDNTLLGNEVWANTGLGIDLEDDGLTDNDSGDGDSGSNDLLNFPVITSAEESGGTVTATYDLDVPANPDQYRVEFFVNPSGADPSGYGEAETFVSAVTTGPGTGLTHVFSGSAGDVITATATRIDTGAATGFSSTSELSAAVTVLTETATLWLSTAADVGSPSGAPGLGSWSAGSMLEFGDPSLAFEPPSTSGTFSLLADLDAQGQDGNVVLVGLDLVETATDVGASPTVSLLPGDLLLSTADNEVFVNWDTSTTAVESKDVVRFRPQTPGDYTSGTFSVLLDQPLGTVVDVSLVEADTMVGDQLLPAGSVLMTDSKIVYHLDPTGAGPLVVPGVPTVLLDGPDVAIDQNIVGVHLVDAAVRVDGIDLTVGDLLVSIDNTDSDVGNNGIAVVRQDVFLLELTRTTAGPTGLAAGDATLFFDGSDVGLDVNDEDLWGIALVGGTPITTPSAVDDTVRTSLNTPWVVAPLVNDEDPNGDPLSIVSFTQPTNGTVTDNGNGTLTYSPDYGHNGGDSFTYTASDGTESAMATVTVDVRTPELWMATDDVVDASGTAGLTSWTTGQVLSLGDPGLTLDPPTTSATVGEILDLDRFATDGVAKIGAIHEMRTALTVGTGPNAFNLVPGDMVLISNDGETFFGTTTTVTVSDSDVVVFRPDSPGDPTSSGEFYFLLENPVSAGTAHALTVVEAPTIIGDTFLTPGTFLFSSSSDAKQLMRYTVDATGLGTTGGTLTELADLSEVGLGGTIDGMDLIERDVTVGGTTLVDGTVLLTTDGDTTVAGLPVQRWDLFAVDLITTTLGAGTTTATATLVFDGSDTGFDDNPESLTAVYVSGADDLAPGNSAPVAADDTATTAQGVPVTIDVVANDSDADTDPLTVIDVVDGSNGTVVDNGDGTLTYSGGTAFSGTDVFAYTISDGNGSTDTALVTVTVTAHSLPRAIYRSSGQTAPRHQAWNGTIFGGELVSATVGEFRIIQGAESPSRDEAIVVGVDNATGTIAGERWNGSSWTALPALGSTTQTYWWSFDVAYEAVSGDAMVVYADGANLNYRVWNGSTWSAEASITEPLAGTPRQMQLASHPWADEMVLVVSDDSSRDYALVWDGSAWGNPVTLHAGGAGDRTDVYAVYEQQSGTALVVYGKGTEDVYYRTWNGGWSSEAQRARPGGVAGYARWTTLAADPTTDRIALGVLTDGADVWLAMWDGAAWMDVTAATTTASGTNRPAVAVAFEGTSGQALAAYSGTDSTPEYRTWVAGTGWSAQANALDVSQVPNSVMLYANPVTDEVMLATQDSASDLNYTYWNGTTWVSVNEVTTNTGDTKNQPFLFLWNAMATPPPTNPVVTVNSTGDSGDSGTGDHACDTGGTNSEGDPECTLRAAIEEANASTVVDTIQFAIPTSDAGHVGGVWTVSPATTLPQLDAAVTIDATTQTGYSGSPVIELEGSALGAGGDGLVVGGTAEGVVVSAMAVISFPDDGITVNGDNTLITDSYIGMSADGVTAAGNGTEGIVVQSTATGTSLVDNVVSGQTAAAAIVIGNDSTDTVLTGNLIGTAADGLTTIGNRSGIWSNTTGSFLVGGTTAADANTIVASEFDAITFVGTGTMSVLGNTITGNGGIGLDLDDDGVTVNDLGDGDAGANGLLNHPVLTAPVSGDTTVGLDLDVPAGDYRIEVFANPTEGADPSGYGEGESLVAAQIVTHTGSGPESFVVAVPALFAGDVLSATATEDPGGGSYGATSEFSTSVTVLSAADPVIDASVRRSDVFADGGLDPASAAIGGTAGSALTFNGGGDLLRGPALDITDAELSVGAWIRPAALGGTDLVVSKRTSGGDPVYELGVNGTGQAVAALGIGGGPVTVQGGTISTGTWHHVAVTWDGTTVRLYVDGSEVDTAPASGSLSTDTSTDVILGNRSTGTSGFDGEIDHVEIGHLAPTATEISLRYTTVAEQALTVTVGQQQTDAPGAWIVSGLQTRSGGFALAAPETADSGAAAWAVATGIDEPGTVFETWWWASTATGVDLASGTRAGQSPTDQFDAAYVGAGTWDLRRRSGAVDSVDGSGAQALTTGAWVKVEQWTDQNGNSRLLVDGVEVAPWTAQTAPPAAGSLGLRVGRLPGGQSWYVDDPRARRLVMPEPTATLGPLDRD